MTRGWKPRSAVVPSTDAGSAPGLYTHLMSQASRVASARLKKYGWLSLTSISDIFMKISSLHQLRQRSFVSQLINSNLQSFFHWLWLSWSGLRTALDTERINNGILNNRRRKKKTNTYHISCKQNLEKIGKTSVAPSSYRQGTSEPE